LVLIYIKATPVDRPQLGYVPKHAKEWQNDVNIVKLVNKDDEDGKLAKVNELMIESMKKKVISLASSL